MFLGEHRHSLDDKGRVILPVKFRKHLEDGAVVTIGQDGCLCVYTEDEWQRVALEAREHSKLGAKERQGARSLFAGASEIVPDRQGRIALPANLRTFAGLERDVVVTGAFSRVEIWDAERWSVRNAEGEASLAEAADLPAFGM